MLDQVIAARMDPRPMAFLRIIVGLAALLACVEITSGLHAVARPDGLRVSFLNGLSVLPEAMVPWFLTAWHGAAGLVAIGCCTRRAGVVLMALMSYALLVDQQLYSNHLYLLILEVLFLVLGDAGAAWSIDQWRCGCDKLIAAWPSTLWKLQISIVYFFAAAAKLNESFLSGEVLASYWPAMGPLGFLEGLRTPQVLQPLAIGAVGAEFFLAFALWLRGLRTLAVIVGVGLHAGMILLVAQKDPTGIVVFALASLPPYLLFYYVSSSIQKVRIQ